MTKPSIGWTLLFLCALLTAPDSKAQGIFTVLELKKTQNDDLEFQLSALKQSTQSNYDLSGISTTVQGLESKNHYIGSLRVLYGFIPKISIFADLRWSLIEIIHTNYTGNAYGLSDQNLGFSAQIAEIKNNLTIYLQGEFWIPSLYDNQNNQKNQVPLLGEGVFRPVGGVFANLSLDQDQSWNLRAGAGFSYPLSDFSSSIPFSVFLLKEKPKTQGPICHLGVWGLQSLQEDTRTLLNTSPISNTGNSLSLFAQNPTLVWFSGGIGYQFDPKLWAKLSFEKTFLGFQAPDAWNLKLDFSFTWMKKNQPPQNKAKLSPLEYEKSNSGFLVYDFETSISEVNSEGDVFQFSKPETEDFKPGDFIDVFTSQPSGTSGDQAIARAIVIDVGTKNITARISERYQQKLIEKGFLIKKPIP